MVCLGFFGSCLENGFQIDRNRVIYVGNDIFLMHVAGRKKMKERKPGAGTLKKLFVVILVGTPGVANEFGPAVSVASNCARRLKFYWWRGPVQPFDQSMPTCIESQVLGLVHNPRAAFEAHDLDRVAAIVWIRETALDLDDLTVGF